MSTKIPSELELYMKNQSRREKCFKKCEHYECALNKCKTPIKDVIATFIILLQARTSEFKSKIKSQSTTPLMKKYYKGQLKHISDTLKFMNTLDPQTITVDQFLKFQGYSKTISSIPSQSSTRQSTKQGI